MKLYIARHGETRENVEGILQGRIPGTLTPRGIEQAVKLADVLDGRSIGTIYSSPLSRAFDTAVIISNKTGAIILTEDSLVERSLGIFEGKPVSEFFESQGNSGEPYILYRPEEGETLEEMKVRVEPFLRHITAEDNHEDLLLVGHGGTNTIILEMLLPLSLEEVWEKGQDNACLNILEVTAPMTAVAIELNSCRHLNSAG